MTKREVQAQRAAVREEVAELRREKAALRTVFARSDLDPQLRITAIVLGDWYCEQVPGADDFVRLDAEDVARRAGTTPAVVHEQVALLAEWGRLEVEQRPAPAVFPAVGGGLR